MRGSHKNKLLHLGIPLLKVFQQGAFLGQDCIEQNCRFSAPVAAWRYAGMRLEYALEMTLVSETQPISNIGHIMT